MQSRLLSGCGARPCQRRPLVSACCAALPALKHTGSTAPESPHEGGVSVGVRVLYREVWGPCEDFSSSGEITGKVPELQTCVSWDRDRVGAFARPGPVVPNSQPLWAVSKPWSNTTPAPCVSLTTAPPWEFHGDVLLKGMPLVGGGGLGWGLLFCCSVMSGFFATLQTAAQWGRVLIKRRAPHPHAPHPF